MVKAVLALAGALLTGAFVWLWFARSVLPYSEEGQYFDTVSGVTYSEGAVTAYSVLALLTGLVTVLLAAWAWRR